MTTALDLKALRQLAREDLDDVAKPYLWTDAFLNGAAAEAEIEACRRGRLILDSKESSITRIDTTVGENLYELDHRIIFIRRVMVAGRSLPVKKIDLRDLDAGVPGWESHEGTIERYCLNHTTGHLLTYRKPSTSDEAQQISLTVVREPLNRLEKDGDRPEIEPRLHSHLRHWMVFLAYMKPDEDTYRPDKAKIAEALFTRQFGAPSDAVDERWIRENHGYDEDEGLF